jgi:hypothetical protein
MSSPNRTQIREHHRQLASRLQQLREAAIYIPSNTLPISSHMDTHQSVSPSSSISDPNIAVSSQPTEMTYASIPMTQSYTPMVRENQSMPYTSYASIPTTSYTPQQVFMNPQFSMAPTSMQVVGTPYQAPSHIFSPQNLCNAASHTLGHVLNHGATTFLAPHIGPPMAHMAGHVMGEVATQQMQQHVCSQLPNWQQPTCTSTQSQPYMPMSSWVGTPLHTSQPTYMGQPPMPIMQSPAITRQLPLTPCIPTDSYTMQLQQQNQQQFAHMLHMQQQMQAMTVKMQQMEAKLQTRPSTSAQVHPPPKAASPFKMVQQFIGKVADDMLSPAPSHSSHNTVTSQKPPSAPQMPTSNEAIMHVQPTINPSQPPTRYPIHPSPLVSASPAYMPLPTHDQETALIQFSPPKRHTHTIQPIVNTVCTPTQPQIRQVTGSMTQSACHKSLSFQPPITSQPMTSPMYHNEGIPCPRQPLIVHQPTSLVCTPPHSHHHSVVPYTHHGQTASMHPNVSYVDMGQAIGNAIGNALTQHQGSFTQQHEPRDKFKVAMGATLKKVSIAKGERVTSEYILTLFNHARDIDIAALKACSRKPVTQNDWDAYFKFHLAHFNGALHEEMSNLVHEQHFMDNKTFWIATYQKLLPSYMAREALSKALAHYMIWTEPLGIERWEAITKDMLEYKAYTVGKRSQDIATYVAEHLHQQLRRLVDNAADLCSLSLDKELSLYSQDIEDAGDDGLFIPDHMYLQAFNRFVKYLTKAINRHGYKLIFGHPQATNRSSHINHIQAAIHNQNNESTQPQVRQMVASIPSTPSKLHTSAAAKQFRSQDRNPKVDPIAPTGKTRTWRWGNLTNPDNDAQGKRMPRVPCDGPVPDTCTDARCQYYGDWLDVQGLCTYCEKPGHTKSECVKYKEAVLHWQAKVAREKQEQGNA